MLKIFLILILFFLKSFTECLTINDPNLYDVLVVGGGVSGLSAMSTLAKAGRTNTILLEGANRLGGRAYTIPFGANSHIELGAQVKENLFFFLIYMSKKIFIKVDTWC